MKKMLKGRKFITVAELRKDRSLLPRITGDISGLYGEISNDLYGEISGDLYGEISGLTGNVTGLHGDIDECEITDGERTAGVRIESLIGQ